MHVSKFAEVNTCNRVGKGVKKTFLKVSCSQMQIILSFKQEFEGSETFFRFLD